MKYTSATVAMTNSELLAANVPYCYWLDLNEPDPDCDGRFRVAVIFQDVPGYRPTGGDDVLPWYWNEETCRQRNERLGLTEKDVSGIVASSMFPRKGASR